MVVVRFNAYLGLNPEVKYLQIRDLFSQITQRAVTDSESSLRPAKFGIKLWFDEIN